MFHMILQNTPSRLVNTVPRQRFVNESQLDKNQKKTQQIMDNPTDNPTEHGKIIWINIAWIRGSYSR